MPVTTRSTTTESSSQHKHCIEHARCSVQGDQSIPDLVCWSVFLPWPHWFGLLGRIAVCDEAPSVHFIAYARPWHKNWLMVKKHGSNTRRVSWLIAAIIATIGIYVFKYCIDSFITMNMSWDLIGLLLLLVICQRCNDAIKWTHSRLLVCLGFYVLWS